MPTFIRCSNSVRPLDASFHSDIFVALRTRKRFRALAKTFSFLGFLALSSTLSPVVHAQQIADLEQGLKAYGSYHGGDIDQVSMTNGNLTLRIPLTSFPQRGRISNDEILTYSAKNYTTTQQCDQSPPGGPIIAHPSCYVTLNTNGSDFGVTLHNVNDVQVDVSFPTLSNGTQTVNGKQFTVVTADGGNHLLGYLGSASGLGYAPAGSAYRALDGSGYVYVDSEANGPTLNQADEPGTLWLPNGDVIQTTDSLSGAGWGRPQVKDPDGNMINTAGDTLGRLSTMQTLTSAQLGVCPDIGGAALNQAVVSATTETYADGSQITFCYANVNVNTNFLYIAATGNGNDTVIHGPFRMLQSVLLQDRKSYWGFLYDSSNPNETDTTKPDYYAFGELQKLIYPTGGFTAYKWDTEQTCVPAGGVSPSPTQPRNHYVISRTMNAGNGSAAQTWTYQWFRYNTNNAAPFGHVVVDPIAPGDSVANETVHWVTPMGGNCNVYETETDRYQGSSTSGSPIDRLKENFSFTTLNLGIGAGTASIDVRKASETEVKDGGGTKQTAWTYNDTFQAGSRTINQTPGYSATFGSTALSPVHYGKPSSQSEYSFNGSLLRTTAYTYAWQTGMQYLQDNLLDTPTSITVSDGTGAQMLQTINKYDEASYLVGYTGSVPQSGSAPGVVRGHVTTSSRWLNTSGALLPVHTVWYTTGVPQKTIDARNNTSAAYDYSSGEGSFASTITDALGHTNQFQYNFNQGTETSTTDSNGQTTRFQWDLMKRLLCASHPDGGLDQFTYPSLTVSMRQRLMQGSGGGCPGSGTFITDYAYFDGLGRTTRTQHVDPVQGDIYADFGYDAFGRQTSVSNPYRTGDPVYQTQTQYDALSRPRLTIRPDNSTVYFSYAGTAASGLSGDAVTETDEAGVRWQRTSDTAGRLAEVLELGTAAAPSLLKTSYLYDANNNLTNATQYGASGETARVRTFKYDSLSRLLWSSNPESAVVCYGTGNGTTSGCQVDGYDANGNLLHKTDARSVRTDYSYDALNRLTQKSYSNGAHFVGFGYDGADANGSPLSQYGIQSLNSVGRLSHESNWINADQSFSYDSMGRVSGHTYCLPDNCGNRQMASATYDLAGDMIDLTYPSGRHIRQAWDPAGRLKSSDLVDIGGVTQTQSYLQPGSYFPDGSLSTLTLGNGVLQTVQKNSRLQVQSMVASTPFSPLNSQPFLSHTYCYVNCPSGGPVADNGNIGQITDSLNGGKTQSFTYDTLNRIKSFSLGGTLNQQYAIDSFGNLSGVVSGSANTNFDPATNRISNLPCASSTQGYDAAGNQTCDLDSNNAVRVYGYDAESRISQIAMLSNPSNPFEAYTYHADGSRVRKLNSDGSYTEYVDFNGQPIAEKDQTGTWTDYIYAGDKKIAKAGGADTRTHIQGTVCASCGWQHTGFRTSGTVAGLVVQTGDKLVVSQFQTAGTRAGIGFTFTDGTYAAGLGLNDQDGGPSTADTASGHWHHRVIDLSSQAGKTVSMTYYVTDGETAAGAWSVDYRDFAYVRKDGTVTSLTGTGGASALTITSGETGVSGGLQSGSPYPGSVAPLHFYLADHLGTAQMEFGQGGWPVWQGQFAPFGGEIVNGAPLPPTMPDGSSTHYKFTGKERDAESGLDYFGARYYGSNMGRWMSPDWADKPEAVPYSDLMNPQSLNLYGYVNNNPLSKADKDGHCPDACVVEGISAGVIVGVATVGAAAAYLATPSGQRSLSTFTSAFSSSVSSSISSVQNFFSSSKSGSPAPAAPVGAAPAPTTASPAVPTGLVGVQDGKGGPAGGRVNSGPLAPEHGGTGDAGADFGHLTGGNSGPAPQGSRLPPGTQVGDNGTQLRPPVGNSGPRIDVPANGPKPVETLHYPKP